MSSVPSLVNIFSSYQQVTIHRYLPYGLMAGLAVVAAIVAMTLPETFNQPTMEDLESQEKKDDSEMEKLENLNGQKPANDEKSALV